MEKPIKVRERKMLVDNANRSKMTAVFYDMGIDYDSINSKDYSMHIVVIKASLPRFIVIEKVLNAKKVEYQIME